MPNSSAAGTLVGTSAHPAHPSAVVNLQMKNSFFLLYCFGVCACVCVWRICSCHSCILPSFISCMQITVSRLVIVVVFSVNIYWKAATAKPLMLPLVLLLLILLIVSPSVPPSALCPSAVRTGDCMLLFTQYLNNC